VLLLLFSVKAILAFITQLQNKKLMTLVTTPSIMERLNHDFIDVFRTLHSTRGTVYFSMKKNDAIDRLGKNKIITVSSIKYTPADGILLIDRYAVSFTLADKLASHFVLLRGLLEFSRPNTIKIIATPTDKTFYTEFTESQADDVVTYIETIAEWLVKEIKFKKALRALIIFEKRVKREHAILYAKMQGSI
jgi:hypothetical protein